MEFSHDQKINLLWVAIDRYRDRQWPALQNSVTSSETLEDTLKVHYSLTDSEITCLPNKQATLPEIERTLRSYLPGGLRELDENDQLIISFSGHGERDKLTGETAFIPYDGDPESPSSWFRFNTLKPILKNIAAHHILVLSDSCFSGGVFRSKTAADAGDLISAEFARRACAKRSRMMLSSGGDELVQDFGGTVGNSVFMDGLVHALKTPIEPWLLAEKLFHDTRNYVVLNAHQTPEFGYLHDSGHAGGQLLLSKTLTPSVLKFNLEEIAPEANPAIIAVDENGPMPFEEPVVAQLEIASKQKIVLGKSTPDEIPKPPIPSIAPQTTDQDQNKKFPSIKLLSVAITNSTRKKLTIGTITLCLFASFFFIENFRDTPKILSTQTNTDQNSVALSISSNVLITACDQQAGSSNFKEVASERTVNFEDIQALAAVSACEAALRENPTHVRSMHQLGRAYDKMARESGRQEWASKAIRQYEKACAAGSPSSCYVAGNSFDNNAKIDLVDQDYERANGFFLRGCELGIGIMSAKSCDELGLNYEHSKGFDQNYKEAFRLYEIACNLGSAEGCDHLGDMYQHGKGVVQASALAAKFYKSACDDDYAMGCGHYAAMNADDDLGAQNFKTAAEYFLKSCDLKNGWSCGRLAEIYEDGNLGAQNFKTAAEYFLKGCDLKHGWSCGQLADLHEDGDLGKQNFKTAAEYFLKGCDLKHGWSCGRLASIQLNGKLGSPNFETAATYFLKGCQLNSGWSCRHLGEIHAGSGLKEANFKVAAEYMLKGCELQDGISCRGFAVFNQMAELGGPNNNIASEYYGKGCALEDSNSCSNKGWGLLEGYFADETVDAIDFFIKSLKLGGPGPFSAYYPEAPKRYVISESQYKATVRKLQDKLRDENALEGPSDGVVGSQTLTAARKICNCRLPLDP